MALEYERKEQQQQPHFVLFPLMAQGHIIPMMDIGRLLARRGVIVTILTTPVNANRFKNVISRESESGKKVEIIELPFPCVEVGLPEGSENLDSLPSQSLLPRFFAAARMLQQPIEELLPKLKPRPCCIISDLSFPWTNQVAEKFHIPRIAFHGMCCFVYICVHNLLSSRAFDSVKSDSEYFEIPGLPHKVELTKAQMPGSVVTSVSGMDDLGEEMKEAEANAFGMVANTFEELETDYIQRYRKVKKKKVWCIGPVSLCNKNNMDKAERGGKASIDEHHCMNWLGLKKDTSVIYVCLGSLSRLSTRQMIELALGLEGSQFQFILVLRYKSDDFEKWLLDENFEERIKDKGLLIHGWAPQVLILSHPAISGFLTHCGWNSTLEGISAGVPLITWPNFAEQFCNERLIVNVLKIGLKIGVEIPVKFGDQEKVGVQVNKNEIKAVLDKLMDEGEEIRERAKKLGEMATSAILEEGSSCLNLSQLIQDVMEHVNNNRKST